MALKMLSKDTVLAIILVAVVIAVTVLSTAIVVKKNKGWDRTVKNAAAFLGYRPSSDLAYVYGLSPAIDQCKDILPKITRTRLNKPIMNITYDELSSRYDRFTNLHKVFFKIDVNNSSAEPIKIKAVCHISAASGEMVDLEYARMWY